MNYLHPFNENTLLCFTDIDSRCTDFDNGTALHIAASNLAHEAVKVLLQNGANPHIRDDMDKSALGMVTHCLGRNGHRILRSLFSVVIF